MSEITHPAWLDMIGMTASITAFACAVYLQVLYRDKVDPKHVFGFIGIGFALFLLTFRSEVLPPDAEVYLRAVGYILFILLELKGVHQVIKDIKRDGS